MGAKRAGRVPGARALAGTANRNFPQTLRYSLTPDLLAWKHVVCVLMR
ncbi:hypothetical protein A152_0018445 [Vibrio tasmaniensis 1F-187]|nr:hypothetical protein [Vibrio tasmaniensis]